MRRREKVKEGGQRKRDGQPVRGSLGIEADGLEM